MFGKNIPIKPVWEEQGKLRIIKIWDTIQGEGPYTGRPAIFIRLAGCNLQCHFCDTDFETGAMDMGVLEIMQVVEKMMEGRRPYERLVVLTGGEPMAQNIVPLIGTLYSKLGVDVQIETAGTVWPPAMEKVVPLVRLVCSPKTPRVHGNIARYCRDWKYIISAADGMSETDGLPMTSTQERGRRAVLFRPPEPHIIHNIWVQPCEEYYGAGVPDAGRPDAVRTKENWKQCVATALRYGYRISLQTHKLLGVE